VDKCTSVRVREGRKPKKTVELTWKKNGGRGFYKVIGLVPEGGQVKTVEKKKGQKERETVSFPVGEVWEGGWRPGPWGVAG